MARHQSVARRRPALRTEGPIRTVVATVAALIGSLLTVGITASPASADPFTYSDISAGYHAACAVTTEGTALCWGWNRSGALATENRDEKVLAPSRIVLPGGARFASIEAGEYATTCGIDTDAGVWCWGEHHLGSYFTPTSTYPVRVELPAGVRAARLSNGGSIACAVSTRNELWCWGDVLDLGNGSTEATRTPELVPIPDGSPVADVQVGPANACALTTAGAVWCWGTNDDGEVGIGYRTAKVALPAKVVLPQGTVAAAVTVGLDRACALSDGGRAWCWGDNYEGALGDGTYTDSPSPVAVITPGNERLASIDTAWYHTCAIAVSGTTWCWGRGGFGELGSGTTLGGRTFRNPVVPAGTVFTTLSAGLATTCAIDTAGRVWCWTGSDWGVAGTGDATKSLFPRLIARIGSPTVNGIAVERIGAERASVRAMVNPNGARTTWSLEVSTDPSFVPSRIVASTTAVAAWWASTPVSLPLAGLAPRTRHWVRVTAANTYGTTTGEPQDFVTLGSEPVPGAVTVDSVTGTAANVRVSVDPGLLLTSVRLEWSASADFAGSKSLELAPIGADEGTAERSGVITGMSPRTRHWVRVTATNRLGTVTGSSATFETVGDAPVVTGVTAVPAVDSVSVSAAVDTGRLDSIVTASVAAAVAPSRAIDSRTVNLAAGSQERASFVFGGLSPAREYLVSVTATNVLGTHTHPSVPVTTRGGTPSPGLPETGVPGTDNILVTVPVDPGGLTTRVILQVSTDPGFRDGVTEHYLGTVTGDDTVRRSIPVRGLAPRTAYHLRAVASNVLGSATGPAAGFRTATPVGVLVNDGDDETSDPSVVLTVTAPRGTDMTRVSNFSSMDGARVLPLTGTVNWILDGADSPRSVRTVWVQFLAADGRVILASNDSIILLGTDAGLPPEDDDAAPELSSARITGASASGAGVNARGPRATVAGRDLRSGIVRVEFRAAGRTVVHRVSRSSRLNGSFAVPARKGLWVRLVDAAGNASRWARVRGS
jgi:alpha-tubulin suppressor-like RCC1 family protein